MTWMILITVRTVRRRRAARRASTWIHRICFSLYVAPSIISSPEIRFVNDRISFVGGRHCCTVFFSFFFSFLFLLWYEGAYPFPPPPAPVSVSESVSLANSKASTTVVLLRKGQVSRQSLMF